MALIRRNPDLTVVVGGDSEIDRDQPLDRLYDWFNQYVHAQPYDIQILALWTLMTHISNETYTAPRLLIGSITHGCGKTTVLEHLEKLGYNTERLQANATGPLLANLLRSGPRTLLTDEAEKMRDETKGDFFSVFNTGYRQGAIRPVLIEGTPTRMACYGPLALAGNYPDIPDDSRERCLSILLTKAPIGQEPETDWEEIEDDAKELHNYCAEWVESNRSHIKSIKPKEGIDPHFHPGMPGGRFKEVWRPLMRVAIPHGPRWTGIVADLAAKDAKDREARQETEKQNQPDHIILISDLHAVWTKHDELGDDWYLRQWIPSEELCELLAEANPDLWGPYGKFGDDGKVVNTTALASKMRKLGVSPSPHRDTDGRKRQSYYLGDFLHHWRGQGLDTTKLETEREGYGDTWKPSKPSTLSQPSQEPATG